jgi:hypothetical protein
VGLAAGCTVCHHQQARQCQGQRHRLQLWQRVPSVVTASPATAAQPSTQMLDTWGKRGVGCALHHPSCGSPCQSAAAAVATGLGPCMPHPLALPMGLERQQEVGAGSSRCALEVGRTAQHQLRLHMQLALALSQPGLRRLACRAWSGPQVVCCKMQVSMQALFYMRPGAGGR